MGIKPSCGYTVMTGGEGSSAAFLSTFISSSFDLHLVYHINVYFVNCSRLQQKARIILC